MDLSVYRGKHVFVTGHTGFKGSWLCEWLLALGAEVYGYALKPPTKPALFDQLKLAKRITSHVIGDVRDLKSLTKAVKAAKPDFVFHLAAQPLVRLSYEKPVETFDTNVMGTVNLLEALRVLSEKTKNEGEVKAKNEGEGKAKNEGEGKAKNQGEGEQGNFTNSAVGLGPSTFVSPWHCSAVLITTDKCYENKETTRPYKEDDPMGGYDPYSCSKGCDELVISSYRRSFFNSPDSPVWIASARAGNVIGGGDWAKDRIVPDAMRAWLSKEAKSQGEGEGKAKDQGEGEQRNFTNSAVGLGPSTLASSTVGLGPSPFALHTNPSSILTVRNSRSTRPWQHVLEPLSGYLTLGAALDARQNFAAVASGFNFGPNPNANRTVKEVVEELLKHTKGKWIDRSDPHAVHEAGLLNLNIAKARKVLGWRPTWDFEETIEKVAEWYVGASRDETPLELTQRQIAEFWEERRRTKAKANSGW